ncbi:MAG: DUF6962 family protein [bacterium]
MLTSGMAFKTAVTNIFNACAALILIVSFLRHKPLTKRDKLWINAYLAFFFVCLSGFVLHAFVLPEAVLKPLWCIMFWCLDYMLASYVKAVRYDIDGSRGMDRFRKIITVSTILFSLSLNAAVYLLKGNGAFMLFSCFALVYLVYIIVRLAGKVRECPYFLWYLAAIAFLITGSILQTIEGLEVTIIWTFNRDCIYHFMTFIFVLLQYIGIVRFKGA